MAQPFSKSSTLYTHQKFLLFFFSSCLSVLLCFGWPLLFEMEVLIAQGALELIV